MQTQLVDDLLADLLQDVRFLPVYIRICRYLDILSDIMESVRVITRSSYDASASMFLNRYFALGSDSLTLRRNKF